MNEFMAVLAVAAALGLTGLAMWRWRSYMIGKLVTGGSGSPSYSGSASDAWGTIDVPDATAAVSHASSEVGGGGSGSD